MAAREIEESLFLQSARDANWILQRDFSTFVVELAVEGSCLGDGKTILRCIVDVETPIAGVSGGCL